MAVTLFSPYRILLNKKSAYGHFMGGEFDGPGSECPNCRRRLVIYLNLDLSDQRIRFPDKRLDQVQLVYCLECELFHFDFIYRVKPEGGLQILLALKSKGRPATS